jgi:hypothetical protein
MGPLRLWGLQQILRAVLEAREGLLPTERLEHRALPPLERDSHLLLRKLKQNKTKNKFALTPVCC